MDTHSQMRTRFDHSVSHKLLVTLEYPSMGKPVGLDSKELTISMATATLVRSMAVYSSTRGVR